MKFDLGTFTLTLVVSPADLRSGYSRLSVLAQACLGIDVDGGHDVVAFISKNRRVCCFIWCDGHGTYAVTRKLHRGRFEQFLIRADAATSTLPMTQEDFLKFLDGEKLFEKRAGMLY